jgi:hypothetical protein
MPRGSLGLALPLMSKMLAAASVPKLKAERELRKSDAQ